MYRKQASIGSRHKAAGRQQPHRTMRAGNMPPTTVAKPRYRPRTPSCDTTLRAVRYAPCARSVDEARRGC